MKKRMTPVIFASLGMMILILDGKTALQGAREGVQLCLGTLIPSLFPFFVLSVWLTGSLTGNQSPLLRPLERLFRVPSGCGCLVLIGMLGGYPVGAQNIAIACRGGQLSKNTARRMISFCNNAGPAFLFGMIAPAFSSRFAPWLLWLIHLTSAWLVSLVIPPEQRVAARIAPTEPISIHQALSKACRTMASVCGWVVLFRILLTFLEQWVFWLLPAEVKVIFSAVLELSNGCVKLAEVQTEGLRFVIASSALSFGGICVMMQTRSAAENVSLMHYYPGKLLQTCFSFLASVFCQNVFPQEQRWNAPTYLIGAAAVMIAIVSAILLKSKKYSSIPLPVGV